MRRIPEGHGFGAVPHLIPADRGALGRSVYLGDCDIQLFDPEIVRRFRLDRLRFGDLVAIADTDLASGDRSAPGR
jgi:hypothetical protein